MIEYKKFSSLHIDELIQIGKGNSRKYEFPKVGNTNFYLTSIGYN